ncbi:hypothetical protein A2U01_0107146, partial [Trifolium medium]|nr:hypothetical protein [Trifolium medium]
IQNHFMASEITDQSLKAQLLEVSSFLNSSYFRSPLLR